MIKRFGIHPVQYGVVKDHGVYEHFNVSIEVHDDAPDIGVVFLNGKEVGQVRHLGKKQFESLRQNISTNTLQSTGIFKTVGKAAAGVISEYITN